MIQYQNPEILRADVVDINERLKEAIVLYIGSPKAIVNGNEMPIDSQNSGVSPMVENSRTLVPLRFIAESLGARVDWDSDKDEITVKYHNDVIYFTVGSNKMLLNGSEVELEVAAEVDNGRTLVPLRALAEALGKYVFYDRGLIIISDKKNLFDVQTEKAMLDEIIARVNVLPSIGSKEEFKRIISDCLNNLYNPYGKYDEYVIFEGISEESAYSLSVQDKNKSSGLHKVSEADSADYSTTNIQVEGVDEADIVKTDGQYIYQVNKKRIIVAKAYPADQMKIAAVLEFPQEAFNPEELYVDEKYLIVIGSAHHYMPVVYDSVDSEKMEMKRFAAQYQPNVLSTTKAIIYDISDKSNIKNVREVEIEGRYLSSRKIGSSLYLFSNRSLIYNKVMNSEEGDIPAYRDTAVNDEFNNILYEDIQYFPKYSYANYMIAAGLNLDRMDEKVRINTYLGAGENIYVSDQHMYVAVTQYNMVENEPGTLIYKFSLNQGNITYLSKGSVPGTILNQFSMDEYHDHFRIATTRPNVRLNENTSDSTNNLYILDDTMNITGKIEDIAPGERIYSTRFMGDRGYMITFRTIDPLFVMDLSNPQQPKILGALKIPGFSNYLHPYDENHVIGFGKDTTDTYGGVSVEGLKIAIFDVTDIANPKEKFVEIIGDAGTDSPLLYNHKALLFSKEKKLLAFPVTVVSKNDQDKDKKYSRFTFQGAYVYNIDLDTGFTLKGKITHLSEKEYNPEKNIDRLLYIDNMLYTLSNKKIKANDLDNLTNEYELNIPSGN